MKIELIRTYDLKKSDKGCRVLVDRVWPRGVKKENLDLDEWCKEIAPSTELRKWFDHDPERWKGFRAKYLKELKDHKDTLKRLRKIAKDRKLILVYSAKDEEHNQAVIIRDALKQGA